MTRMCTGRGTQAGRSAACRADGTLGPLESTRRPSHQLKHRDGFAWTGCCTSSTAGAASATADGDATSAAEARSTTAFSGEGSGAFAGCWTLAQSLWHLLHIPSVAGFLCGGGMRSCERRKGESSMS